VTTSFSTPSSLPRDLSLDGSGNLLSEDIGVNSIYIHSGITSTITTSFSSPDGDPTGLTLQLAAAGWTGIISGVTNPAAIMGVAVANIASVKGVA